MKRRTKAIVEAERMAALGAEATLPDALIEAAPSGPTARQQLGTAPAVATPDIPAEPAPPLPPEDWRKGALLNVRIHRGDYVITLYPEELDDERPERALRFTNVGECQNFVSSWYSRETPDPRAIR